MISKHTLNFEISYDNYVSGSSYYTGIVIIIQCFPLMYGFAHKNIWLA